MNGWMDGCCNTRNGYRAGCDVGSEDVAMLEGGLEGLTHLLYKPPYCIAL